MIHIKAPKGLGDAIYLRVVVIHLLERTSETVFAYTLWWDLFADLVVRYPKRLMLRSLVDATSEDVKHLMRFVSCSGSSPIPDGLDEYEGRCRKALEGVAVAGVDWRAVKLDNMQWPVRNPNLLMMIKREARGRPILVTQALKTTFNSLMEAIRPKRTAYVDFLDLLRMKHDFYVIRLGHRTSVCRMPEMDEQRGLVKLDLTDKGFIFDTMDICSIADLFYGEICFMNTIAEALGKPNVIMFSASSRDSTEWVRYITPQRVFHLKHLSAAVYDDGGTSLDSEYGGGAVHPTHVTPETPGLIR